MKNINLLVRPFKILPNWQREGEALVFETFYNLTPRERNHWWPGSSYWFDSVCFGGCKKHNRDFLIEEGVKMSNETD